MMILSFLSSFSTAPHTGLVGGPYTNDDSFDFDLGFYSQSLYPSEEDHDSDAVGTLCSPTATAAATASTSAYLSSICVREDAEENRDGAAVTTATVVSNSSYTTLTPPTYPSRLYDSREELRAEKSYRATSTYEDEQTSRMSSTDGYLDMESQFTLKVGLADSISVPRSRPGLRSSHVSSSTSYSSVHVEDPIARINYSSGKGNYNNNINNSNSNSCCGCLSCRPSVISCLISCMQPSSAVGIAFKESQERDKDFYRDRGASSPSILAMAGWA